VITRKTAIANAAAIAIKTKGFMAIFNTSDLLSFVWLLYNV
jgi:hypothetical protein